MDDLGISIVPGSYISIEQTDGFVYVYTQESGTIPYVIVGYYNITAEDFTNQFTQYMAQEYSDLQVTSQESMITLNDREFSGIVYSYNVGGYVVQDTRLFFAENGNTYMFGAKEIPELSYYVGSTLEETAGSFAYLAGGDSDYTKHVDGTRSVTSDAAASDPIEDIESTVSDVLGQGGAGNDQSWRYSGKYRRCFLKRGRWTDRYGKYRQLSNGKYHIFSGKCQLRRNLGSF